jgi:carbon monoxide dehydrogenase subunit G
MHFEGSVEINAPRDKVWAFVTDPAQVGQCGPGVESVEQVDDTHYKAVAKVGVGFITAKFTGNIEIAEMVAPDRSVMKVHGQAPGSAADAVITNVRYLSPGRFSLPNNSTTRVPPCAPSL